MYRKVPVSEGDTDFEPGTSSPLPISRSISTVSIRLPPQERVADSPLRVEEGEMLIEQEGSPLGGSTVTRAAQVAVPPAPVTVPVKVVSEVIAGVVVEPPATGVTEPIPWSIVKEVAFVVVQVRVAVPFLSTSCGLADRGQTGVGGAVRTRTTIGQDLRPPSPATE